MAGLLAWAADVVGGSSEQGDGELPPPPVVFTTEQHQRAAELDRRSAKLREEIRELRLRIPSAHAVHRLPDLSAASAASAAALALQLHAHSATREEAQQREVTLLEENAAHERAISNCQKKIQEKLDEASLLETRLRELDMIEQDVKAEMDKELSSEQYELSRGVPHDSISTEDSHLARKTSESSIKAEDLELKKKELSSVEEMVQELEEKWSSVEQESYKRPSPAQREKILEKQLHSLVEQLTAKQAQAEAIVSDIRTRERELERLNGLWRRYEYEATEAGAARNRFGRSSIFGNPADYEPELPRRYYHTGIRTGNIQKNMILRSTFVLYILVLHVIVFIKLSF